MPSSRWKRSQSYIADWYGDCVNTYAEETQQIEKARFMGLEPAEGKEPYRFPVIFLGNRSVVDIGGGPCSLLLKCLGTGRHTVLEPCDYPAWVMMRYAELDIEVIRQAGEESLGGRRWDEAWIYNTLRHVDEPKLVVENARQAAKLIRVFEWIDTPTFEGHELGRGQLDSWFGGEGKTAWFEKLGRGYWGEFDGGAP